MHPRIHEELRLLSHPERVLAGSCYLTVLVAWAWLLGAFSPLLVAILSGICWAWLYQRFNAWHRKLSPPTASKNRV